MSADNIVLYFSVFVGICVIIWAYVMINEFNKISKNTKAGFIKMNEALKLECEKV